MSSNRRSQPRRPAGTPVGGQFAPTNRPEANGIELVDEDGAVSYDSYSDAEVAAGIEERLVALERFTTYGPEYNRSVATSLSDYHHFHRLGETDAAEHYLLLAETQAGLYTWDEFAALDPFERITKERREAEARIAADVFHLSIEELSVADLHPGDLLWHDGSFFEVVDKPFGAVSAGQPVTRVSVQRLDNPVMRSGSEVGNPVRHLDYLEGDTVMGRRHDDEANSATSHRIEDGDAGVSAAATRSPEAPIEAAEEARALAETIDGPSDEAPAVRERPSRPSAKEAIARIFPYGEPQRGRRRHKLLPQELVEQIPGLYETEETSLADKVVYAHYFTTSADWYIVEFDRETGEMFGRCDLGLGYPEWGYVRIQDLADITDRFGLPVERDLSFRPTTARELGLTKEQA